MTAPRVVEIPKKVCANAVAHLGKTEQDHDEGGHRNVRGPVVRLCVGIPPVRELEWLHES